MMKPRKEPNGGYHTFARKTRNAKHIVLRAKLEVFLGMQVV